MWNWVKLIIEFVKSCYFREAIYVIGAVAAGFFVIKELYDYVAALFMYPLIERCAERAWRSFNKRRDKKLAEEETKARLKNKEIDIYYTLYLERIESVEEIYKNKDSDITKLFLDELKASIRELFKNRSISGYIEIQNLHAAVDALDVNKGSFEDDLKYLEECMRSVIAGDSFNYKSGEKI